MPIETFHISSESTHNKQQSGIKSICTEERGGGGEVMTATNMCSNFGSKWSVPPLKYDTISPDRASVMPLSTPLA